MQPITVLYVLNFTQFRARKLLLSIVFLKFLFNYRVFSTKLHAHKMFRSRDLEPLSRVAPKGICGPLAYMAVVQGGIWPR